MNTAYFGIINSFMAFSLNTANGHFTYFKFSRPMNFAYRKICIYHSLSDIEFGHSSFG